jgi:heme/copper-type cytochrome/quinol oxidase subunit 2
LDDYETIISKYRLYFIVELVMILCLIKFRNSSKRSLGEETFQREIMMGLVDSR